MPSAKKMGQMTLSEFSEESSSRISVVRKDALEMLELERVFSQQGRIGRWRNYITKDTKGRPTILKQSTQPPPQFPLRTKAHIIQT